jgi:putative tryptophan/tyrosine transport system substrate-binding protein
VNRRHFISLFGGSAVTWPLAARAQQAKVPTIGWFGGGTPATQSQWAVAFTQRLRQLGWSEGSTLVVEYRWGEGRPEHFAEIAAEFVRLKVDVILAAGTEPALAAKKATAIIPIVFPLSGDPVGTGLVASLARPGANVTGVSNQARDLAAKRLEILSEVVRGLRRCAVLANAGYSVTALEIGDLQSAGRTLGIEILPFEIRRSEDIGPAFETLKGRAEALYIVGDPLLNANQMRINVLALTARLPTIYPQRLYLDAGGLMSYGPNFLDLNRRAADVVDKILRGAKPADLPVEQPTKFELVVNLITAKALGLDVPPTLLGRADEVIE